MTPTFLRRGHIKTAALGLLTLTLVPALSALPAVGSPATPAGATPAASTTDTVTPGDTAPGLDDLDLTGTAVPSAAQRAAVAALGDVEVRWNSLGTPGSLLPSDGSLGAATAADPVDAARSWLGAHAGLFGLSPSQISDLELVNSQKLADSDARAVLFRQTFGGLAPASGSLVTVGVADGQIAYVSSSITKTTAAPPAAVLSPLEGWLKAAANVGRTVPDGVAADIVSAVSGGWTRLTVPGFAQQQTVRVRALALADGSVRPVIEAHVLDTESGAAFAYSVLVDAVDGKVLVRRNAVDNAVYNNVFQGTVTPGACGPLHEFQLDDDATKSISAVALALPVDDVIVKFFDPSDNLLGSYDLATSPEVATYTAASIPAGIYKAQVCPFDSASVTLGAYAMLVSTSDTAAPGTGDLTLNPKWRYFTANPDLPSAAVGTPASNSVIGCWRADTGCTTPNGPLENIANSGPWDTTGGVATMTTIGNNANTHEAWANPLAPGGTLQAPVSPTREYTEEFTDAWNESGCNTSELVPGGNDINASVGNLFVSHNRMHDYSYYLGFTEDNYNMQLDNRGHSGVAGDAEVGNAQAGAIDGGAPSYLGRNNANQITLNDGVPGITNQYLFQPMAGAFYAPCADGGLDMSIVGHEYTHAISNRMIGGPDGGITSEQGGAMGESWGDLNAGEYMFENDYSTGTSPWAVGPYATGNPRVGIRNYAIDQNPLNYSDYGFDSTGVEVHADGEIWNGTMWEVRQALVEKWNAQYPYNNKTLQKDCVTASAVSTPLPASACPGNRRWIQLVFDAFLLQQSATSMLDARDAMIAADQLRFGGANKDALWAAFARRGMGAAAATPDADSGDPTPDFSTPTGPNQSVTFQTYGAGSVYVGDYEARATPIADTIAATPLGAAAKFTPGTYRMLYVSPDRGFQRFTLTVPASSSPQYVTIDDTGVNTSSKAAGGSVLGATAGSLNTELLIDGTEATNWGGVTTDNVDVSTPNVAVGLAGGTQTVRRVNVSAMLNPAADDAVDANSGSRFTALRKFALEACTASCGSAGATWTRFYTSPDDAFPSEAPRPVAPTLTMRAFDVPDTQAAAVRLVALQNQCTGNPAYAGELDTDDLNATDCKTGSDRGTIVHAAELQVFSTVAPGAPVSSATPGLPGQHSTAKTKTRLKLTQNRQVQGGQPAHLKIKVISARKVIKAAGKKLGKVVIYDNGKKVRSFKLKKKGKKTWVVPANLSVGRHRLRVVFKPADPSLFKASRSRNVILIVESS